MSHGFSFEKLFRSANEKANVTHARTFVQEDTSNLETIYEDEKFKKARTEADQFDIDNIRSMFQQVILPSDSDQVLMGRLHEGKFGEGHQSSNKKSAPALPQMLGDWESEVKAMFQQKNLESGSQTQQHNDKKPTNPAKVLVKKTLNGPDSFSRAFQQDFVDIDEVEDPYDTILPNAVDETEELYDVPIATIVAAPGHTGLQASMDGVPIVRPPSTTLTAAQRGKLFQRFGNLIPKDSNAADDASPLSAPTGSSQNANSSSTSGGDATAGASGSANANAASAVNEKNLNRHQLIALKRKQKADRLSGINPYFDPTQTLKETRASRSAVAAGTSTFRDYHGNLVSSLTHAPIAATHRNTKPDLSETELRHFHRPRMTAKEKTKSWLITVRPRVADSNSSNGNRNNKLGQLNVSSIRNPSSAAGPQQQTLALASASAAHDHQAQQQQATFVLVEYSQEHPPLQSNYGMSSLLVNFYRPSTSQAAANDAQNEDSVSKSEAAARREQALVSMAQAMEKHHLRLPRHVSLLWQLHHNPQHRAKYERDADIPRLELGQTVVLNAEDEAPFLGWEETDTLQPALINRLFRAPLFPQRVQATDFLLVRTKVSRDRFDFVLKEIPFVFVAGQMEPLRIVPAPPVVNSQVLPVQRVHCALVIARLLETNTGGVSLAEIERSLLRASASAPHREVQRRLVRELATSVIGKYSPHLTNAAGERLLVLREDIVQSIHNFRNASSNANSSSNGSSGVNPLDDSAALQALLDGTAPPSYYIPDRLARAIAPEDVCLAEASQAAEVRLRDQHLLPCDLGFVKHYLHFHMRVKHHLNSLLTHVLQTPLPSSSSSSSSVSLDALKEHLQSAIRRLDLRLRVARHLYDRLLYMPWNTTEAFVHCVVDRHNSNSGNGNLADKSGVSASSSSSGAAGGAASTALLSAASMPVGNLSLFPYHSAHPSQPKVLDVHGAGDPSGRGEAFAHKRFINAAAQAAVPPQQRESGTRKPEALAKSDKDLRRLTKPEAIAIVEAMGVPREIALALPRWDRIHIIREYVLNLEKQGRMSSSSVWSKYLRDDRASSGGGFGSRRLRRLTYGEYGDFGTMEQFKAACKAIWQRQQQALSSDEWQRARSEPMSIAAQRQQRKKQRREQRHFLESKVQQQEERAEGRGADAGERRKKKKAKSKKETSAASLAPNKEADEEVESEHSSDDQDSSSSSSDASSSSEAKKKKKSEQQKAENSGVDQEEAGKEAQDGSDDDDDDEQDALALANALKNRASASSSSKLSIVRDDLVPSSHTPSVSASSNTTSSAAKKRKVLTAAEEEQAELQRLNASFDASSNPAAANPAGHANPAGSTVSGTTGTSALLLAPPPPPPPFFQRPAKVVRRIVHSFDADGKATTTITFDFDAQQVLRVERQQHRLQEERISRRLHQEVREAQVARRLLHVQQLGASNSSSASAGQGGGRGRGGGGGDEGDEDFYEETSAGDMVLKLGKMQERAEQQLQRGGRGFNSNNRNSRNKQNAGLGGHGEHSDLVISEEDLTAMKTASRRYKTATDLVHSRLPQVTLAACLEKEIMALWLVPHSAAFHNPVDVTLWPTYLTLVPEPICLRDIRERCARYEYDSAAALLLDVTKMAQNAERFNGPTSPLTKSARKLVETLQKNLAHNRTLLGPHHDVFAHLEQQIRRMRAQHQQQQQQQPPL